MRILMAHNYYQQPGGEDMVAEMEGELLQAHGHEVHLFQRHNDEIQSDNLRARAGLFLDTTWSRSSYRAFRRTIQRFKPDITHFHNFFPLISPSAFSAARREGVAIVQTLHNYRLLCLNGFFFREGRVCQDCLGRLPWRGVIRRCYRDSAAESVAVATMLTSHRLLQTWARRVDLYLAPSKQARRLFLQAGLPPEKIVVKPNFVDPDPGPRRGVGDYALYAGRLSAEKGVLTLLKAWSDLASVPLRIAGDGPLIEEVKAQAAALAPGAVTVLGRRPYDELITLMKGARFLVFPSECYETFGRTIIEAFACGLPVIAAKIGAAEELVEDGRNGLHFQTGKAADLAAKVTFAVTHPRALEEMGRKARRDYEAQYSARQNYASVMKCYEKALS